MGFGLSPNGQMPGSDVVIGWVTDQGEVVFHVAKRGIWNKSKVQRFKGFFANDPQRGIAMHTG